MAPFASTLGCVPLAIASGAGADPRVPSGTAVIGGPLVARVPTQFIKTFLRMAAERP